MVTVHRRCWRPQQISDLSLHRRIRDSSYSPQERTMQQCDLQQVLLLGAFVQLSLAPAFPSA